MPSIINATSTGVGGLISTGNNDDQLVIQTGDTTAVTIGSDQSVILAGNLDVTGSTTVGSVFMEDNLLVRPLIKDYALEGVAIGNVGATRTFLGT